jgi:hypothetical protein
LAFDIKQAIENKVLMRGVLLKRGEIIIRCGNVHCEELRNFCCQPNTVRIIKPKLMRWAGHIAHMTEERNAYSVLVTSLARSPKCSWENNIKNYLTEI